jgi:hypothetical protein
VAEQPEQQHVTPHGRCLGKGEDIELDPETDALVLKMTAEADEDIARRGR